MKIAGSFALFFFGQPRATGDIDIRIRPDEQNAERVLQAVRLQQQELKYILREYKPVKSLTK